MFYLSGIFRQHFIILNTVNGSFNVYTQDIYLYLERKYEIGIDLHSEGKT